MKLAHLQLHDGWENKQTLIARLKDGSIHYRYYTGWGSSGIPLALSNLQAELPMDNERGLSVEDWRDILCGIINVHSTKRVVKVLPNKVKF